MRKPKKTKPWTVHVDELDRMVIERSMGLVGEHLSDKAGGDSSRRGKMLSAICASWFEWQRAEYEKSLEG